MTRFPKKKLIDAFHARFGGEVESDVQTSGGMELHSFYLVSIKFKDMPALKRQDAAWEVVDATLSRDEAMHVSAILPLAPGEIGAFVGK